MGSPRPGPRRWSVPALRAAVSVSPHESRVQIPADAMGRQLALQLDPAGTPAPFECRLPGATVASRIHGARGPDPQISMVQLGRPQQSGRGWLPPLRAWRSAGSAGASPAEACLPAAARTYFSLNIHD